MYEHRDPGSQALYEDHVAGGLPHGDHDAIVPSPPLEVAIMLRAEDGRITCLMATDGTHDRNCGSNSNQGDLDSHGTSWYNAVLPNNLVGTSEYQRWYLVRVGAYEFHTYQVGTLR